ncbi:Glycine cleavage system transcriptional activator [Paraburkholderia domus]|jgi:Transcriptional regulator|uniref:Glycine cleavage system transcriptional activator n=1 Tax=Paraburkholderia domus TaxID=2793075 RepID=A0A9N8N318_9BURK|nr:LysR substrate-binding domain-containing protein [Paraburkholderia domus]MBK5052128.1 LysR family transcriptional regulator [Burkholderia sp. R-70006]MBK5064284.1 LysR family transcriptional regulator [Burkholderia sp. R-70199]MBK5089250.1 LysR family transcriptional regulator [Burkholderia sp. R-69927]MBK5122723.1 LysR family transcriptional regulator [Burkholderia sp. R-69980]MBK5168257.1 LysR family transcriptional regulator [Burkholderia sp. R-70211]MBK5183569.1 LysR family transcripti
MPLRLPPLPALRFFEAAGRHQSFKLAAAELNVTPSAISHGIVGLEQSLGVELFVREPRGISLTAAGADYLSYVSEAFSLIAIGTQRLPNHRANRPIALSCAPTLASRWLLPRLAGFRSRWPDANVTVDTSHRQVGFPVDGFDFAIRLSRAPVAGTAWTRLFGERLVPVCSPAYLDHLRDEHGKVDLRHATLIHVNSASEDWQAWLDGVAIDGTAIEGIELNDGLRVDTIQLAFEAASMGLGVALGRRPLVDRDLTSGALVEASPQTIASSTAYWLVSAQNADSAEQRPELFDFKRWLLSEAEQFDHPSDAAGTGLRRASH